MSLAPRRVQRTGTDDEEIDSDLYSRTGGIEPREIEFSGVEPNAIDPCPSLPARYDDQR